MPGWLYPVCIDTASGTVKFDNYAGSWGDQEHLDKFMQAYAVEKATIEARKKGYAVTEQALAEYLRCRRRSAAAAFRAPGPGWVDSALADEVAFDAALIRYARSLGLRCDSRRFGWPHDERRMTERLLATRGALSK